MQRIKGFTIIELLSVIIILALLAYVSVPKIVNFYKRRAIVTEAKENLKTIRDYEEAYRAQYDKYISCQPNPANIPGKKPMKWQKRNHDGWSDIGFEPKTKIYYQYEVWTSLDKLSFTIYARGDLNNNGITSEISLDQDGNWSISNQFE